jgi:FMN phosphatase YigB (HAD superfamily)
MQIFNEEAFNHKPDAVMFDLDNTLYLYEDAHEAATAAARRKACEVLGTEASDFDRAFALARQDVKKNLGGTASSHSRLLYFQRTIERLGMKTMVSLSLDLEQTYWRAFMIAAQLRPGAIDFLMDLRALGIMTAVLTDLTAQIQFRKIVFFELEGLFDYVVTSEEAGTDKTGLRPYALLGEKLALPAGSHLWMVGDDACDLLAKETLGATTLFLKDGPRDSAGQPDLVFSDFSELRRLVSRWDGEKLR